VATLDPDGPVDTLSVGGKVKAHDSGTTTVRTGTVRTGTGSLPGVGHLFWEASNSTVRTTPIAAGLLEAQLTTNLAA
jgi:hypothetical protein